MSEVMTRDEEPVARIGGISPDAFPHICHFQANGATKVFCKEQTGNAHYNGNGCCATKCNSELRKCFVCLAIGRRGIEAKYVSDPKTGCCSEHSDKATMVPGQGNSMGGVTSSKRPKRLTKTEYAAIQSLDADEKIALHHAAYGYELNAINEILAKAAERVSNKTAYLLLGEVYRKLGVYNLETDRARKHAACKMYLDFREMEREDVKPIDEGSVDTPIPASPAPTGGFAPPGDEDKGQGDADKSEKGGASPEPPILPVPPSDKPSLQTYAMRLKGLDSRTYDILNACVDGLENTDEIADALNTTKSIVSNLLSHMYQAFALGELGKFAKRPAALDIYRKLLEAKLVVRGNRRYTSAASKPTAPAVPDQESVDKLAGDLNAIIDRAETYLQALGKSRMKTAESQ